MRKFDGEEVAGPVRRRRSDRLTGARTVCVHRRSGRGRLQDPPPALYFLLTGMRVGGRRLVQVEGDYGYPKGKLEIPPGGTFNMEIEVLK